MKLEGKIALVTGGGTGIGAAITKRFVEEGAKVCITGRRRDRLEQQAATYTSGSVAFCAGDVAVHEDVKRMVETTVAFGGGVDILVNNAACDTVAPITELDPDDWRRVLDTNLTGPFLLMRESIPLMIERGGGSIINVASIGGLRCMPAAPAYGSSKAGLIFLTQQAARDYSRAGIRCNALCPGATRTEMLEEAVSNIGKGSGAEVDDILAKFASVIPIGRISSPSEIAAVAAFLASDDSSFMTGAVLVVDGGATVVDVSGAAIL